MAGMSDRKMLTTLGVGTGFYRINRKKQLSADTVSFENSFNPISRTNYEMLKTVSFVHDMMGVLHYHGCVHFKIPRFGWC